MRGEERGKERREGGLRVAGGGGAHEWTCGETGRAAREAAVGPAVTRTGSEERRRAADTFSPICALINRRKGN